ncbi:hypothetical protein [Nocardia altamirensis]|uniref:hypothetical protein n=1 Tax=Nocardia altamirensis TaxID=472158 RepID=UPI00083FDD7F|nr:hypothetical protein [Nocardia altamirensis]
MVIRVVLSVAAAIAASAFVFAGESAAGTNCTSNPGWGQWSCREADVATAYCIKEAKLWTPPGKCVEIGGGRSDLWLQKVR